MIMDKKRIFIIIAFILSCFLIGYLLYILFFAPRTQTPLDVPGGAGQGGLLPSSGLGGQQTGTLPVAGGNTTPIQGIDTPDTIIPTTFPTVRQVVSDPVKGSSIDTKGAIKFYDSVDGKFYTVDARGQTTPLSDEVFFNVDRVTWSPQKNESIIEYPDGANIYYNFDSKKQVTLPKHWEDFSFSKDTGKIAAKSIALSAENRWLVVSNPDGSDVELVESLGENADKVTVQWSPNNQIIALAKTGEALGADRQDIHLVGLHGENFRTLTVEGRGFESIWSPEGKRLLYSVYSSASNFNPELWIANAEGTTAGTGRKNLGISTWSSKCSFLNEQTLYCAVPSRLEVGTGYAPDLANNTPDIFYKIDINSGIKTQIPVDASHVVNALFVGPDGKTMYFTDKAQPGLFSLPL